ncbi:MAG TPA: hypothetical protein VM821_02690, partial [Abditibacteriaceae bacterium]|nr:hypothetical protein [Abditibacteriaceae bacterium]
KNGARLSWVLRYRVDMTAPQGQGTAQMVQASANGASRTLRLELQTGSDTTRVSALLPWGEKVELKPSNIHAHRFFALVTPPASPDGATSPRQGDDFSVTYILTDRAHNRASITVDGTK